MHVNTQHKALRPNVDPLSTPQSTFVFLTTHYLLDQAVPKKIARLFLVSDILHNASASVPNASSYRSHFPMRRTRPVSPASQSTCICANWPRLEAALSFIWR